LKARVFRLFLGIEHGAQWAAAGSVFSDSSAMGRIAFAGDLLGRFRGARVEDLQTRCFVGPNGPASWSIAFCDPERAFLGPR